MQRSPSLCFFVLLLCASAYSFAYARGDCGQSNCAYLPLIIRSGVTPIATATFVSTAIENTSMPISTATPTENIRSVNYW